MNIKCDLEFFTCSEYKVSLEFFNDVAIIQLTLKQLNQDKNKAFNKKKRP